MLAVGDQKGRLILLEKQGSRWLCRCDCGVEKSIDASALRRGRSTSCGGHREYPNHRKVNAGTYNTWNAMIQRCTNPNNPEYPNYGARGITVCQRWLDDFEHFMMDMGPRPAGKTLDRYPDKGGNYEPTNCRWAGVIQQQSNKRTNRYTMFDGEVVTVAEYARRTGYPERPLYNMMNRGELIEVKNR